MVCSVDFSDLEKHPVARQLYHSLLDYLAGSKFSPTVAVAPEAIRGLLFDSRIMHRLQATAEADGRPANELIDGDPNTLWTSAKGAGEPHTIVIHFPQPEAVNGLVLMPRQNDKQHTGDLRDYRLETSPDGTNWQAVAGGQLGPPPLTPSACPSAKPSPPNTCA